MVCVRTKLGLQMCPTHDSQCWFIVCRSKPYEDWRKGEVSAKCWGHYGDCFDTMIGEESTCGLWISAFSSSKLVAQYSGLW